VTDSSPHTEGMFGITPFTVPAQQGSQLFFV